MATGREKRSHSSRRSGWRTSTPHAFSGRRLLDDGAKERLVGNVSRQMASCSDKEIIKRQIGIFRGVSEDLASRLERATGVKGYPGISGLRFNGTHNGMAKEPSLRAANGMAEKSGTSAPTQNGAPVVA